MKKEYSYEVERLDDGWIVYKSEVGKPEEKILGYQVELNVDGKNNHRCSCEAGSRSIQCKHLKMVIDKLKQLEHNI